MAFGPEIPWGWVWFIHLGQFPVKFRKNPQETPKITVKITVIYCKKTTECSEPALFFSLSLPFPLQNINVLDVNILIFLIFFNNVNIFQFIVKLL